MGTRICRLSTNSRNQIYERGPLGAIRVARENVPIFFGSMTLR